MNYLATTNSGRLYYNKLQVFQYNEKSLYSNGENSLRFIKKLDENTYILGAAEELLIVKTNYKFEIIGRLKIPGLVDIKDIVIGGNFIAILSGLRDSVYIFNKKLTEVHTCFNISENGYLEFFTERQSQCQEINNSYLQIYYCPEMNNFHRFNRLTLNENILEIINDENFRSCFVDLSNFTYEFKNPTNYTRKDIEAFGEGIKIDNELITDFIQC